MAVRTMMIKSGLAALLAGTALIAAAPALAHTPYVVPFTFSPERDYVGVEGGMAEEGFFIPDFAIRGAGDWSVVGPDGVAKPVTPTTLKSVTVVDAPLPAEGTYRIGTGQRPGRQGKVAKVDGVWRQVRPDPAPGAAPQRRMDNDEESATGPIEASKVPAGAEIVETQGILIAETYVTRGAPTPVKPTGQGFEIEPVTHPSEVYLDDGFTFRALVDGKPVPGLKVTIYRGWETYAAKRTAIEATTGADGKAQVKFEQPGAYVLETRYPGPQAPGAAPAAKTYIYTLSFEVTD